MKTKYLVQMTVALLITSGSVFAAEGVEAVDQAWQKAMLANDLEGVVACYAKDAVMFVPGEATAQGLDAVRKAYAEMLGANTVTAATISNTHYQPAGEFALGWGEFTLKMKPKSGTGDASTMAGRFSAVAKKEGGKWVYMIDHASEAVDAKKP